MGLEDREGVPKKIPQNFAQVVQWLFLGGGGGPVPLSGKDLIATAPANAGDTRNHLHERYRFFQALVQTVVAQ